MSHLDSTRRARPLAPILPALLLLLGAAAGCSPSRPAATKAEQVFRFRLHEDPPTLDPALANDQFSEAVILNVDRGLVELDPLTLEVRPAVADTWTISPDHRVYTFHLRDGVRFHNGRGVTSQDVAYSFRRLLRKDTGSPRRFLLEPLEGAQDFIDGKSPDVAGLLTPDERTVVLRLTKPFAPFLAELTMANAAILPKEAYEDPGKGYLRAPVGCGPFRLARWEQGNFIELLPFDGFYSGRPALDRVVVRMIENQASALQEYVAGGLDSLDETPDDSDAAMMAKVGKEIRKYPFIGTGYIGFNLALPPFAGNSDLRKAFN